MLPKVLSTIALVTSLSFMVAALLALAVTLVGVDYFVYAIGRLPLLG